MSFQKGNTIGVHFSAGHKLSFKHGLSGHPDYKKWVNKIRQRGLRWSDFTLEQKKEFLNA